VTAGPAERTAFAPAKVNLTLRIGRKRPDGYHDLESLVVFADFGDTLRLTPSAPLGLTVEGPTAAQAGPADDNLVIKAVRALEAQTADLRTGHFHLSKSTPVAAGLGGGSSDAAAALRLVAGLNGMALQDHRVLSAARATGADVPVCVEPVPRFMRGIGEILSAEIRLPRLAAVLVNAGVPVPTARVFRALAEARKTAETPAIDQDPASRDLETAAQPTFDALMASLAASGNDLEAPAVTLFPAVGAVLDALRALPSCRLTRMSGSGGTCFGLFETADDATDAAARLRHAHPDWWVQATMLGAAPEKS